MLDLIRQPHAVYTIPTANPILQQLEALVPGVLVYARWDGLRRRVRVRDLEDLTDVGYFEVIAPIHGAWLAEQWLSGYGVSYDATLGGKHVEPWRDIDKARWEERGRGLTERLVRDGVLRENVVVVEEGHFVEKPLVDALFPFQAAGVGFGSSRPWTLLRYSAGAGKTVPALILSAVHGGSTLVVCPAKARPVWAAQIRQYTHLEPYIIWPGKDQEGELFEYLGRCHTADRQPFVVVGLELISDYAMLVSAVQPETLIIDELHMLSDRRRWKPIPESDGSVSFEKRKTPGTMKPDSKLDRDTRAVTMMELTRMRSVRHRIGMTASPLDDGRPRGLWAPFDLLSPGGFGYSYWATFALRYCDGKPEGTADSPWPDDRGRSCETELRQRASFFMHDVPRRESHKDLPPLRVEVVRLDPSQQVGVTGYAKEQQAILKEIQQGDQDARYRMVESMLAEACAAKRKYVIGEVIEGLKGGGKVVVFTARKKDCELWAKQIKSALERSGSPELRGAPVWMGHGEVSSTKRHEMVVQYQAHEGACCLVGTGQAFGTAVDGFQCTDLAIFAMLPWKPGDLTQWAGRFDRHGGCATLLRIIVATETYDEKIVTKLADKIAAVGELHDAEDVTAMGEALLGLNDEAFLLDLLKTLGVEA